MKLLRQPLLQFLILGGLICGLYVAFADRAGRDTDDNRIVVDVGDIEALAEGWRRTWSRVPTPEELVVLVEAHIAEEMYYREALALGLDRDDTIVRRRMRQKLEFLAADLIQIEAPDDKALQDFLDRNAARYVDEGTVSFRHVFIDPAQHAGQVDAVVAEALAALRSGVPPDEVGDRFLLAMSYRDEPLARLARGLGTAFAAGIVELDTGQWAGPVASSYGLHLVRVDAIDAGRAIEFESVRDDVERDWYAERRELAGAEFLRSLAAQYEVEVVWPEGFTPPRPVSVSPP